MSDIQSLPAEVWMLRVLKPDCMAPARHLSSSASSCLGGRPTARVVAGYTYSSAIVQKSEDGTMRWALHFLKSSPAILWHT